MRSFLENQIMGSQTVAIAGHTRPDGDCVGSCMGLYNYIRENYPDISVDVYLEPVSYTHLDVYKRQELDDESIMVFDRSDVALIRLAFFY